MVLHRDDSATSHWYAAVDVDDIVFRLLDP